MSALRRWTGRLRYRPTHRGSRPTPQLPPPADPWREGEAFDPYLDTIRFGAPAGMAA